MSIINKTPEIVKREHQLQEPIAVAVEKYAAFVQSTSNHFVNSALKMVLQSTRYRNDSGRRTNSDQPSF